MNSPPARKRIGAAKTASGRRSPANPSTVVDRKSDRPVPRCAVAFEAAAAPTTFPTAPSVSAMPTAAGDRSSAR
jgi:hypothetical protein